MEAHFPQKPSESKPSAPTNIFVPCFKFQDYILVLFLYLFHILIDMKLRTAAVLSLVAAPFVSAFYLPGVAPHDYKAGELVTLNVNSLTPTGNQEVESIVSLDYYNPQFHFCTPKNGTQKQAESIGSVLFGDRIFNSPFEVMSVIRVSMCACILIN